MKRTRTIPALAATLFVAIASQSIRPAVVQSVEIDLHPLAKVSYCMGVAEAELSKHPTTGICDKARDPKNPGAKVFCDIATRTAEGFTERIDRARSYIEARGTAPDTWMPAEAHGKEDVQKCHADPGWRSAVHREIPIPDPGKEYEKSWTANLPESCRRILTCETSELPN
jgi:hypothetical protein